MLGRTLFKLMGFDVSGKTLLKILGVIAIAITIWLAIQKVKNHFDHIKELEETNKGLIEKIGNLKDQIDQAEKINRDNTRLLGIREDLIKDGSLIAGKERNREKERALIYREIRDELNSQHPSDCPVDPVIIHTLNRLWNRSTGPSTGD